MISYANPGSNLALGFAEDESSLRQFELEVNGTLSPCTQGVSVYQCLWNAGNASEGSNFTLRGKATDIHGNVAWSDAVTVLVDATAPRLALSATSLAALSDGRLSDKERALTGTLSDTISAATARLCSTDVTTTCASQPVLPDNSWTIFAPALGDGVTTTLAFVGYDGAGNASQSLTRTVVVDSVAPQFGATTINQGVFISSSAVLLGYGTVSDGGGVAGVQLFVIKPNGSSSSVPAVLNGTAWTGLFRFDQVGVYQVIAVATDLAGNRAVQVVGNVSAQFAVIPPQSALLTVRVVGNGVVTPTLSSYISGTVVPITATAGVGWSFANWSGAVVTTTNPTTVKLDGDKIITATFSQNSYTVVTATVGGGTLQMQPQQASYRYGTVVTITATADVGKLFVGWSGSLTGNSNPVTMTITGNRAITATFTADVPPPVGDINGDSAINILDLQLLINMILHTPRPDTTLYALAWWQRSDLNNDGRWDVLDLQMLLNLIRSAPAQAAFDMATDMAAQANGNSVRLDTVTADAGSGGTIALLLDNTDAVAAGQFRFTYAAALGIEITGVRVTDRTTGFESVGSAYPTGNADLLGYQVLFYNLSPQTIAPSTGAILTFSYTTTAEATGSSVLRFTQALLASAAAQEIAAPPTDGAVTVVPPQPTVYRLYFPVIQR